jgi:hypothetical protein
MSPSTLPGRSNWITARRPEPTDSSTRPSRTIHPPRESAPQCRTRPTRREWPHRQPGCQRGQGFRPQRRGLPAAPARPPARPAGSAPVWRPPAPAAAGQPTAPRGGKPPQAHATRLVIWLAQRRSRHGPDAYLPGGRGSGGDARSGLSGTEPSTGSDTTSAPVDGQARQPAGEPRATALDLALLPRIRPQNVPACFDAQNTASFLESAEPVNLSTLHLDAYLSSMNAESAGSPCCTFAHNRGNLRRGHVLVPVSVPACTRKDAVKKGNRGC